MTVKIRPAQKCICPVCEVVFIRPGHLKRNTCSPACKAEYVVMQGPEPWPYPTMTELEALIKAGGPKYNEVRYS